MRWLVVLLALLMIGAGLGFFLGGESAEIVGLDPEASGGTTDQSPGDKFNLPRPSSAAESPVAPQGRRAPVSQDEPSQMFRFGHEDPRAPDTPKVLVEVALVTPEGVPLNRALREKGLSQVEFSLELYAGPKPLRVGEEIPFERDVRKRYAYGQRLMNQQPQHLRRLMLDTPREPLHLLLLLDQRVIAIQQLPAEVEHIEFPIAVETLAQERAELFGRFVDEEGNPVAARGNLEMKRGNLDRSTGLTIDLDGILKKQGLAPGPGRLEITGYGVAKYVTHVTLPAGGRLDLGTVVMFKPTTIAGQLITSGSSLEGRAIFLREYGSDEPLISALTDDKGMFKFWDLQPGRYVVGFEDDYAKRKRAYDWIVNKESLEAPRHEVSPLRPVSTLNGSVKGHLIELQAPADVALWTIFDEGPEIDCRLFDIEGQLVASCLMAPVDGREHLWVAPGTYDLIWSREGEELGRERLQTTHKTRWIELFAEE